MSVLIPSPSRLNELGLGTLNADALSHKFPQLSLLMLYGSRARGQSHAGSDWDFGYLANPGLDIDALQAHLSKLVNADDLDLVDLARASGVLRYQVADHGITLFEHAPEVAINYVLEVLRFWLDAGPVIRKSQEAQLRSLG